MSETSQMVVRVAIAISGAPFPSPASIRKARAAIEAMREPANAMVDAAAWHAPSMGQAELVWEAMIDAALASPTKE